MLLQKHDLFSRIRFGLLISIFWWNVHGLSAQTSSDYLARANQVLRSFPDSAIALTALALQHDLTTDDSLALAICMTRTEAFRIKGDMQGWHSSLDHCRAINMRMKDPGVNLTITNLYGLLYWKEARLDSAIQYFLDVRSQALKLRDTVGLIKSHNNLGLVFLDIYDNERAITEFHSGLYYARLYQDSLGLQYLYNSLSNVHRAAEQFDSAIWYIDRSILISEKRNTIVDLQRGYSNKGATYFRMKRYEEAEYWLLKAKGMAEENKLYDSLVKIYYHLSEVYIEQRKFEQAKHYGQKVLDIALRQNFPEDVYYGHDILYMTAKAEGNLPEALRRHELYMHVKDSIHKKEYLKSIADFETKYRTAQKDLELQKLSSDIAILDREKQLARIRVWFGSIGIALALIVYFLQRSRSDMKREKQQREIYSAGILSSREEERKGLSKDLHDHIGQNLVLLNQSLQKGDLDGSKNLTQTVMDDIRKVSRDLYPWQIERLGLEAALRDLIHAAEKMTDILITSEIDPLDDVMDREKSLQIYRIVQECLNNLIKHSNAKSARIAILREGNQINLTVQDNGKGFDYKMQASNTTSLGLMTLRDRIQSLKGKLDIESAEGKGTRFTFLFPAG